MTFGIDVNYLKYWIQYLELKQNPFLRLKSENLFQLEELFKCCEMLILCHATILSTLRHYKVLLIQAERYNSEF